MIGGFIARRNPGTTLYQVVFSVESRGGEIVVQRMHFESRIAGDGRFGPLPDVAHNIVEIALRKSIHRTGRGKVFQVDISRRLLPIHHIFQSCLFVQPIPFSFDGQSMGFPGSFGFPTGKGLCFEVIHLRRPVPRHGNFFSHKPQMVIISVFSPEQRHFSLFVAAPVPALFRPVFAGMITACIHKFEEFAVGNQKFRGFEVFHKFLLLPVFIVPTVEEMIFGLSQH